MHHFKNIQWITKWFSIFPWSAHSQSFLGTNLVQTVFWKVWSIFWFRVLIDLNDKTNKGQPLGPKWRRFTFIDAWSPLGGIMADVVIEGGGLSDVFVPNNRRWESIECSRYFIKTPRDCQSRTVAIRWNLTIVQHLDYLKSLTTFQWGWREDVVDDFKSLTFSKYSSKSSTTSFTTGDPTTQYDNSENFSHHTYHNVCWLQFVLL